MLVCPSIPTHGVCTTWLLLGQSFIEFGLYQSDCGRAEILVMMFSALTVRVPLGSSPSGSVDAAACAELSAELSGDEPGSTVPSVSVGTGLGGVGAGPDSMAASRPAAMESDMEFASFSADSFGFVVGNASAASTSASCIRATTVGRPPWRLSVAKIGNRPDFIPDSRISADLPQIRVTPMSARAKVVAAAAVGGLVAAAVLLRRRRKQRATAPSPAAPSSDPPAPAKFESQALAASPQLTLNGTLLLCTQNLAVSGANQVLLNLAEGTVWSGHVILLSPALGPFAKEFADLGVAVYIGSLESLCAPLRRTPAPSPTHAKIHHPPAYLAGFSASATSVSPSATPS